MRLLAAFCGVWRIHQPQDCITKPLLRALKCPHSNLQVSFRYEIPGLVFNDKYNHASYCLTVESYSMGNVASRIILPGTGCCEAPAGSTTDSAHPASGGLVKQYSVFQYPRVGSLG